MATSSRPAASARRSRVPSGAASASTSAPGQPAGLAPGPGQHHLRPFARLGGAAAQAFERRQAEQRLGMRDGGSIDPELHIRS
jgi:hypothetical protein